MRFDACSTHTRGQKYLHNFSSKPKDKVDSWRPKPRLNNNNNKLNVTLEEATKAQRGSRGIAILFP